jgi:hypothetical protein
MRITYKYTYPQNGITVGFTADLNTRHISCQEHFESDTVVWLDTRDDLTELVRVYKSAGFKIAYKRHADN